MSSRAPTPDALRMRRYRRRQREGLLQARAEVSWRDIDMLVRSGHLKDHEVGDPERLGEALLAAVRKSSDGACRGD